MNKIGKYDAQLAIKKEGFAIKYDALEEKIEQKKKQLERLEQKKEKMEEARPSWRKCVVEPLMHDLEQATGLKGEILGPFGIRGATSIHLKDGDATPLSITLTTMKVDGKYVTCYDTGRKTRIVDPMSIDGLNGFDMETAPLPDTIEEIIQVMKDWAENLNAHVMVPGAESAA